MLEITIEKINGKTYAKVVLPVPICTLKKHQRVIEMLTNSTIEFVNDLSELP